jgi:hypothetical protein
VDVRPRPAGVLGHAREPAPLRKVARSEAAYQTARGLGPRSTTGFPRQLRRGTHCPVLLVSGTARRMRAAALQQSVGDQRGGKCLRSCARRSGAASPNAVREDRHSTPQAAKAGQPPPSWPWLPDALSHPCVGMRKSKPRAIHAWGSKACRSIRGLRGQQITGDYEAYNQAVENVPEKLDGC